MKILKKITMIMMKKNENDDDEINQSLNNIKFQDDDNNAKTKK